MRPQKNKCRKQESANHLLIEGQMSVVLIATNATPAAIAIGTKMSPPMAAVILFGAGAISELVIISNN